MAIVRRTARLSGHKDQHCIKKPKHNNEIAYKKNINTQAVQKITGLTAMVIAKSTKKTTAAPCRVYSALH